ncbi:hypothetical protein [Succinivibrio sp.]
MFLTASLLLAVFSSGFTNSSDAKDSSLTSVSESLPFTAAFNISRDFLN